MATAASMGVLVRTLFIVLFCVMAASYVYLFIFGDYISCFDAHSRWFMLIAADFTTYVVVIGAWIAYKESSWIIASIIMVSMYFLGSHASIGYILIQFYKLSPEESSKDPLYFVLARRPKKDATEGRSVVATTMIFSVLGCLVLGVLIYTIILELTPSYTKYFTSCFITTAIDIYIHIAIFSVWVTYKESSWASAVIWTVLLILFRGVTICAYILRELYYLSPQEPASLIIVKKINKDLDSNDPPLLKAHPNN
ncbi:hypothetical protein L1987_52463 [Smallanthus sonchifolius]|uniref:Uncharacterized protein n=1 Tax=Smallanthus sonchifolius TaxID=185202 RepID=A0ACB9ETI0_9ASTR|nr:hypothetical protein L1987_52463 [Smallanthus sonchifolius]